MPAWQASDRNTVMPYLVIDDADRVIAFAQTVFGAELLREPLRRGDGSLWHADLRIGDSIFMVGEAGSFERYPGFVYIYVPDCDEAYARALAAGAEPFMAPSDQFYGDRSAGVKDHAGNIWWMATHQEDVPAEELRARAAAKEAAG